MIVIIIIIIYPPFDIYKTLTYMDNHLNHFENQE